MGHATAVLVHSRWTAAIVATTSTPRTTSVTLRAQVTCEAMDRQLQVVSMHLPSCMRATDEEYEQYYFFTQAGANSIRGHRRTLIVMGTNTVVARPYSRVVGSALSYADPSPQLLNMAETLTNTLAAKGMQAMNTFAQWWDLLDCQPPSRGTWKGKIYGHMVSRPIDYIAADMETSTRMDAAYSFDDVGYPSDHRALGVSYNLLLKPAGQRRRPPPKPIGWRPLAAEGYDFDFTDYFQHKGALSIGSITRKLAEIAGRWTAPKAWRPPPSSLTEARYKRAMAQPHLSAEERRALGDALWRERGRVTQEKTLLAAKSTFECLCAGGWGAPHLSKPQLPVSVLDTTAGRVVSSHAAAIQAQAHYATLFPQPPQEFVSDDGRLEEELREDQTMAASCCPGSFLVVEDILRARESVKKNKTCADEGVVAEMLIHTAGLDWHWACAFNTRICNSAEAGHTQILEDPCWEQVHVRLLGKKSAPTAFSLLRPIAVLPTTAKLWSRCMLGVLEKYDSPDNPGHLGFKKGHSCAELLSFARAYDSIHHRAILQAMLRRGVPRPIALGDAADQGRRWLAAGAVLQHQCSSVGSYKIAHRSFRSRGFGGGSA